MEKLRIEHKTPTVIRKVISIIFILNGVFWIIGHLESLKLFNWFFGISFTILGILYFKDYFGTEESFIEEGETFLKIKWINRLRPLLIQDVDIIKITLTRFKVTIDRDGNKAINLTVDFFEREQKKEVYFFFTEYAKKKNLQLVKDF